MKTLSLKKPLIIDDFLSPSALLKIQQTAKKLRSKSRPGHVRTKYDSHILYTPTKKNKVATPENGLEPEVLSELLSKVLINLKLSSKKQKLILGNPQFSYYGKNDYYEPHRDVTEMGVTILLFPFQKRFSGGELVFHLKKKTKVDYRKNRVIIFPSHILHEVKPLKDGGKRISLQFFLQTNSKLKRAHFHDDIRRHRKELNEMIHRLQNNSDLNLDQVLSIRQEIMNFKQFTLEGSFRYLSQLLIGKQPRAIKTKIGIKPKFQLEMTSTMLKLCLRYEKAGLSTVITYNQKEYVFPFELMTWEIAERLKTSLHAP